MVAILWRCVARIRFLALTDPANTQQSQEEILEVAKELNESVTSSIVEASNADFHILLEENRFVTHNHARAILSPHAHRSHRYELKLRGTTMMLDERMSTEKILERVSIQYTVGASRPTRDSRWLQAHTI
jgi:hypothetical protein